MKTGHGRMTKKVTVTCHKSSFLHYILRLVILADKSNLTLDILGLWDMSKLLIRYIIQITIIHFKIENEVKEKNNKWEWNGTDRPGCV